MNAKDLITSENYAVVNNAIAIVKQDMAIGLAINSLNALFHVNAIQIESYGKSHGITNDLLEEVRALKDKLEKSKYDKL